MKKYLLKRYSCETLKKAEKIGKNLDLILLKHSDFELFDQVMKKYNTIHTYLDNVDNSENERLSFIERRKKKIIGHYESNLYGFYNRLINIYKNDVDYFIRRSSMEVIVDNKNVIDVSFHLNSGYISIELTEKDYLELFYKISDDLARMIKLNIYEPYTKGEETPIQSYFNN